MNREMRDRLIGAAFVALVALLFWGTLAVLYLNRGSILPRLLP